MNKSLLRKVRDHIRKHPSQLVMRHYYDYLNEIRDKAGNCGTAACIAGWAYAIHHKSKPQAAARHKSREGLGGDSFQIHVAKMLKINYRQSNSLFHVGNWPEPFRMAFNHGRKQSEKVRITVDRINHFIKTGE